MRNRARVVAVALFASVLVWLGLVLAGPISPGLAVLAAQQPPAQATALPSPAGREPAWAFPVQAGSLPAEAPGPKSLPGSTKSYTTPEIDDRRNPPDWFPDTHAPAPSIVRTGRGDALACGSCHLMSGLGHPESADLTGFTAAYLVQQMADFKAGTRHDYARMNGISKAVSDDEARQAAEWFASLPRQKFVRVVEAAMVPRTFVGQGRMRFVDPQGGMEPIGKRIITVPDDVELVRRRDPRSGFTVYVPPGSVARGRSLVETGAGGKTVACAICHGEGMKGLANVPRLAGVHPIYLARQLHLFKDGTRKGPDAPLMTKPVTRLTDDDILNISAYLGGLPPG
jgi:cytochrome c553